MATRNFLYRRGDGNEGNFIRGVVALRDNESPYAALRALVINDYIPGKRVRRHVIKTIEVDGEEDYGLHAAVYNGPDGERAFDAAYITAELQPLDDKDTEFYADQNKPAYFLNRLLDRGAMRIFKQHNN
jgi:hypothetical protein